MFKEEDLRFAAAALGPVPKPCRRLRRMDPTPTFIKHLEKCEACRAVIEYLNRDSELTLYLNEHRN
jgi:hypothetical protein